MEQILETVTVLVRWVLKGNQKNYVDEHFCVVIQGLQVLTTPPSRGYTGSTVSRRHLISSTTTPPGSCSLLTTTIGKKVIRPGYHYFQFQGTASSRQPRGSWTSLHNSTSTLSCKGICTTMVALCTIAFALSWSSILRMTDNIVHLLLLLHLMCL